jgi:hypothetical protein
MHGGDDGIIRHPSLLRKVRCFMAIKSKGKGSGSDKEDGVRYLDTAEAGRHIGLSRKTLEKMRVVGNGPPFRKHGRYVRYTIAELDHWSRECRRRSTSDPGSRPNDRAQRPRHLPQRDRQNCFRR